MAKDIFCNGDFKKLQYDIRQYKKSDQLFVRNFADYNRREQLFLQRDPSAEDSASFFQEKYSIAKQKILFDLEKKCLANLNIDLENRRLENQVHYKILSSDKILTQTTASVIADAILPNAIQLVARSFGNSLKLGS